MSWICEFPQQPHLNTVKYDQAFGWDFEDSPPLTQQIFKSFFSPFSYWFYNKYHGLILSLGQLNGQSMNWA